MRTHDHHALHLPAALKSAAEAVAREDGTTLNQFIVTAVAEKLAALKTAGYDLSAFDRFMTPSGGEPPRPGDEWNP